ncbi:MAG: flagellar biosynthesis anti-sigma factor FlgM [FCB group bacterium]|nr:flagellar biosynthesis anti-sigma factor FlgM [FCB group bacterium]
MNVEHLTASEANRLELNKLKQSAEKTSPGGKDNISVGNDGTDKLSISSEARNLQHTDQAVKSMLSQMPDVRSDKIMAIQERLSQGHYNSDDVLTKSADAVIRLSAESSRKTDESAIKAILNKLDQEPGIREKEVETAIQRKDSGYYNTEEPIRKTAEMLWIPPINRG